MTSPYRNNTRWINETQCTFHTTSRRPHGAGSRPSTQGLRPNTPSPWQTRKNTRWDGGDGGDGGDESLVTWGESDPQPQAVRGLEGPLRCVMVGRFAQTLRRAASIRPKHQSFSFYCTPAPRVRVSDGAFVTVSQGDGTRLSANSHMAFTDIYDFVQRSF